MKIKKEFVLHEICNEYVVIAEGLENIDFNNIISMNSTAAYVWKNVVGKDFTIEDMTNLLIKEYEVDKETATSGSESLAESWINAGICEE